MRLLNILLLLVHFFTVINGQVSISANYGAELMSNEIQEEKSLIYQYSLSLDYALSNRFSVFGSVGKINNLEEQGPGNFLGSLQSTPEGESSYSLGILERINFSIVNFDAGLSTKIYKNFTIKTGISFFRYDAQGNLYYSVSQVPTGVFSSGVLTESINYDVEWLKRLTVEFEYLFNISTFYLGPYLQLYYNKNSRMFFASSVSLVDREYVTEQEFFSVANDGFKHRTELWFAGVRLEYPLFR